MAIDRAFFMPLIHAALAMTALILPPLACLLDQLGKLESKTAFSPFGAPRRLPAYLGRYPPW